MAHDCDASLDERRSKRVHFARGPLAGLPRGGADGHPPHEGLTATAVRHVDGAPVTRLTKQNVRLIDEVLEGSCPDSLQRLKRRVGLE